MLVLSTPESVAWLGRAGACGDARPSFCLADEARGVETGVENLLLLVDGLDIVL